MKNLRKESSISINMEMTIKDEQLKKEMKKVEELGGKLAGMRKKKSKPPQKHMVVPLTIMTGDFSESVYSSVKNRFDPRSTQNSGL